MKRLYLGLLVVFIGSFFGLIFVEGDVIAPGFYQEDAIGYNPNPEYKIEKREISFYETY